jgi:hypothetical protein
MCWQGEAGAVSLGFVHVGQDLEEQEELLECLLAFFTQYLLADDSITCIQSGRRSAPLAGALHVHSSRVGHAGTPTRLYQEECSPKGMVGMHAGQLPAWHSSTRLAQFKYVEDAAEGSAMRVMEFTPHLSFDKLVQSILKLDSGLGASGVWAGTDGEDSVEAGAPVQDASGLYCQEILPAMLKML